jgi:serine/threonine protein kinase
MHWAGTDCEPSASNHRLLTQRWEWENRIMADCGIACADGFSVRQFAQVKLSWPDLATDHTVLQTLCEPVDTSANASDPAGEAGPSVGTVDNERHVRDYRLLEKLGEGGMGAVYKALHTRLGKIVALKLLRPARLANPQVVRRFEREMKAVGSLEHPRIVRAFDAGEHDGTHYLVMEHVEGVDLTTLSQCLGPLEVADACELARQCAEGLDHVHRHGLVHRDIKPSNLMLSHAGEVKLLDLGLALLHSDGLDAQLTGVGQVMGTPDFLAPEQVDSRRLVDGRADIYALGCTLYTLLTSAAPFDGPQYDTTMKKLIAHASEPPPSLGERRSDVHRGLAALVEQMLAKEPDARPATAAEVTALLATWSQGSDLKRLSSQVALRLSTPDAPTVTHTPLPATSAMTDSPAGLELCAATKPAAARRRDGLLTRALGPLLRLMRTRIRISVRIKVVVVGAALLLMAGVMTQRAELERTASLLPKTTAALKSAMPRCVKDHLSKAQVESESAELQLGSAGEVKDDEIAQQLSCRFLHRAAQETRPALSLAPGLAQRKSDDPRTAGVRYGVAQTGIAPDAKALWESTAHDALAAARSALGRRDLEAANELLWHAELDAIPVDLEDELATVRLSHRYIECFWRAVGEELPKLAVGEELVAEGLLAHVVERGAGRMAIRIRNETRAYTILEIPTELAVSLAERGLDAADDQTPVVIGAFHLVDDQGDVEEAKRRLAQAAASGVDVAPLLKELERRESR